MNIQLDTDLDLHAVVCKHDGTAFRWIEEIEEIPDKSCCRGDLVLNIAANLATKDSSNHATLIDGGKCYR